MNHFNVIRLGAMLLLLILFSMLSRAETTIAQAQVFAAEQAFAKSMADRDLTAFTQLIADEAIFFTQSKPLHGKQNVVDAWSAYFKTPTAPFSWEPDQVEVLASENLALSTGPVKDANGQEIGRFNSIWQQQAPGVWRVVFDKGSPLPCKEKH